MKVPRGFVRLGLLAVALAAAGACTRNNPNELIKTGGTECTGTKGSSSSSGGKTSSSSGGKTSSSTSGSTTGVTGSTSSSGTGGGGGAGAVAMSPVLEARVLDYNEALRTASFKLVGNAPTLQATLDLKSAANQAVAYGKAIDAMIADPRFASRMIAFWQNTMRQGNTSAVSMPDRNAAPTFAARIVFEGLDYRTLFTASMNTCPTFDGTMFHDGSCTNGPITAGILTDAGIQFQYYSNLAMRRNRFFQEVFACAAQPAELTAHPVPKGAGSYTSPWPFESIAGMDNGGRVDFHDTSSVVCANCHSTSNHRAPLFANFDANGAYQTTIQVHIPITGTPLAQMSDWLPMGEGTAWKFGVPAADIGELGKAMANDTEVQNCAVARMWNYVMSKGDIVNDAADVPTDVLQSYITQFTTNGFNLRDVLRAMLVSPDFVRF
jgi:hypothetical protein